jgi:hypothetical protein
MPPWARVLAKTRLKEGRHACSVGSSRGCAVSGVVVGRRGSTVSSREALAKREGAPAHAKAHVHAAYPAMPVAVGGNAWIRRARARRSSSRACTPRPRRGTRRSACRSRTRARASRVAACRAPRPSGRRPPRAPRRALVGPVTPPTRPSAIQRSRSTGLGTPIGRRRASAAAGAPLETPCSVRVVRSTASRSQIERPRRGPRECTGLGQRDRRRSMAPTGSQFAGADGPNDPYRVSQAGARAGALRLRHVGLMSGRFAASLDDLPLWPLYPFAR